MVPRDEISFGEARRLALGAQGFDRPRPRGPVGLAHLRRTIRQLGLIQIDYVNVLVPAHYQVLFSRLGPYDRSLLDSLVYRRREFTEHWAHEASIVPMESWPLLRHRRETHRVRPWGFETFLERNADYVTRVLEEVRTRGPLAAEEMAEPEGNLRPMSDRWGWRSSHRRQVFEAHFGSGRFAVADRRSNFSRVYDLAERVIASQHYQREVERAEAERVLVLLAARAQGVATVADLADYYRMPARDARQRVVELCGADKLQEVRVEGWREPAYRVPETRVPGSLDAAALLSPFDPVIWHRPRAKRLFDFDYRIEIFVPQPKRKWGYYVLPFLLGDRLVARVDLKADRIARCLVVLAAYLEASVRPATVVGPLARELRTLAGWAGLDAVRVERRGNLAPALATAARESAP